MERVDRVTQSVEAAGQVVGEIDLVAVVDADVRIDVPEQHAVDAAEARVEVVEIAVDGVLGALDVVEIAVLDHRLHVDEVALRPREFGPSIGRVVVADAHEVFLAPLAQTLDPIRGDALVDGDGPLADVRERPAGRLARRRQVTPGRDVREPDARGRAILVVRPGEVATFVGHAALVSMPQ